MTIEELLRGVDGNRYGTCENANIKEVCNDSRHAKENMCFIAIKGYHFDAHDALSSVYDQGCRVMVVENIEKARTVLTQHKDVFVYEVTSTLEAMATIASNFYQHPSEHFSVIGITGTNGKTSIAQLLGNALETSGKMVGVLGTTGNRIGQQFYPTSNTTVESLKLQWLFKEMKKQSVDACIMEVSSHALSLHRVDQTDFNIAIFTNLTEDHLDFHLDMEAYYQAKKKLFLMNRGASIINVDDPYGKRLYEELRPLKAQVFGYGLSEDSDYSAEQIQAWHDGSSFKFCGPNIELSVDSPIPGTIYVYNVLAVLATLHQLGFDKTDLQLAVKSIRPVSGRLEVVPNTLNASIIVDYAHTPDALEKVLMVCREFTEGKLTVVFGCGGDRDKSKRPLMGNIAANLADCVILTNDNPRTEEPERILEDILAGIDPLLMNKVRVIDDRRKAIAEGVALICEKDTLLIAGKGHENYQIIGETKHHFDDREEASKALLYKD